MQYTEAELKQRIETRLGGGRRVLEFARTTASGEYDSLGEAIQQALDLFNKYIIRTEFAFITEAETSGKTSMTVEFDDDNMLRVVRVDFTKPSEVNANSEDVFSLATRLQGGGYMGGYSGRQGRMAPAGRYGFGDVAFWKQQKEAVGRQTSQEPDWLWDDNYRRLALYIPLGPYEITYEKAYPHTLASLPRNYEADFLKLTEGYARLILADIRGKFGGQIPGPTGGVETDAQTQRDRGQQLVEQVEERLRQLPILAGIETG